MQYSSIREKFASKVFRAPFIPRKFERFAGSERSVVDKVSGILDVAGSIPTLSKFFF